MVYTMKYKYDLVELYAVGVDNIRSCVDKAHRAYCKPKCNDDDEIKAYSIYQYILDNNVVDLRTCLDYVFQNGLWSAWRRGQSTFKDLIHELANVSRETRSNDLAKEREHLFDLLANYQNTVGRLAQENKHLNELLNEEWGQLSINGIKKKKK